jgi:hypothetical protein
MLGLTVLSQNLKLYGIYVSPMEGMENTVYEFRNDTFMYTSGDFFECGVRGETQKGIYSIKDGKINFSPLSPENFQKSIVKYEKEKFRQDRYDFVIHVKGLKNDTSLYFEINLFDSLSLDFPFLTINSSKDWLYFAYGGSQKIKKIEIVAFCYERIKLDFDPSYYGRHIYEIRLAEKVHNYVYRSPYTWEIIEIKPKYIRVMPDYSVYPMIMVKGEYVTDDFIETGVFKEKIE